MADRRAHPATIGRSRTPRNCAAH